MKCAQCGNEIPEGMKFCGMCGAAAATSEPPNEESTIDLKADASVSESHTATVPKRNKRRYIIVICTVIVCIIAAVLTLRPLIQQRNEEIAQKNKAIKAGIYGSVIEGNEVLPLDIVAIGHVTQPEDSYADDFLFVDLQNNTESPIKDAVIAFAAWDNNNLPILIEPARSYDAERYIQKVDYTGINLMGGTVCGHEQGGLAITDECSSKITTVKAIVVSYETFDGVVWENTNFDAFCTLYEGQVLDPSKAWGQDNDVENDASLEGSLNQTSEVVIFEYGADLYDMVGELTIINAETGEPGLNVYDNSMVSGSPCAYAIIDLDGDGEDELVIEYDWMGDRLILHRIGDTYYGYVIGYRGMTTLKSDATFDGSNGASSYTISQIDAFTETEIVMKHIVESDADNNRYMVNGESVTKDVCDAAIQNFWGCIDEPWMMLS